MPTISPSQAGTRARKRARTHKALILSAQGRRARISGRTDPRVSGSPRIHRQANNKTTTPRNVSSHLRACLPDFSRRYPQPRLFFFPKLCRSRPTPDPAWIWGKDEHPECPMAAKITTRVSAPTHMCDREGPRVDIVLLDEAVYSVREGKG